MYCSNLACRAEISGHPLSPMPLNCPKCGGTGFQSWEPGSYPFGAPLAADAIGIPVNTDDPGTNRTMVLVPKDLKCHKCGAAEPWKDPERNDIAVELRRLEKL